jgi:DNA topoisomerase IB
VERRRSVGVRPRDRQQSVFTATERRYYSLKAHRARIAWMPSKNLRAEKKKIDQIEIAPDPVEVAEDAGLRYVTDDQPGYTRKRKGDDFDYFDTSGKPIRDENRLLRIKRIGIPPAYTDVWICPSANGHIQATGRDARGPRRKQVRPDAGVRQSPPENSPAREP